MNVLWDELVNEVVHHVQNVVPTLEHVTFQAKERLRKPPPGDLVYLTDRLIISSAPAVAWPTPSYNDQGRDGRKLWRDDDTLLEIEDGKSSTTPMIENPQEGDGTVDMMVPTPLDSLELVFDATTPDENNDSHKDHSEIRSNMETQTTIADSGAAQNVPAICDTINDMKDPAADMTRDTADSTTIPTSRINAPATSQVPCESSTENRHRNQEQNSAQSPCSSDETNDSQICPSQPKPPDCRSDALEIDVETNETTNADHDSTILPSIPLKEESENISSRAGDPTTTSTADTTQNESEEPSPSRLTKQCESPEAAKPPNSQSETDGAVSPSDDTTVAESFVDIDENDATVEDLKLPSIHQHPPDSALRNSPAAIVTFLEKRHGENHFLAFSLTDERPDDRTLVLFRRQIVQMGWWTPCPERSETPSISQILHVCYAIHAYLQLHSTNVALVYCANGKTRTAIVMACYLKFAGLVSHCREGFLQFLTKRGILDPNRTWDQLPPSLHLFFRQFDTAVHLGGFLNRKPLLLRAVALQGIPVEDKPCLDIWDSSQRHVYTSHPEIMCNDHTVNPNKLSQWADEEGFYRVNVVLEGDFLLLCRFGGDFAEDTTIHDPSKILFRYTNTTGFLSGGYPYEMTPDRVDLSRRYASHLDDEDFLVTLLFEANWERLDGGDDGEHSLPKSVMDQLGTTSSIASQRIYRCHELEAAEEGLRVIVQHHSARPNRSDIQDFQRLHHDKQLDVCEDHLICIALQLTNFDFQRTLKLLLESPSFSWWKALTIPQKMPTEEIPASKWKRNKAKQSPSEQLTATTAASKEMLSLLDEVMVETSFEEPDRLQLQLQQSSQEVVSKESQSMPSKAWLSDPYVQNSGWMVPSLMYPRQGDIVGSFSDHYRQFHKSTYTEVTHPSEVAMTLPRLPFFPRSKPALIPPPLAKRQRREVTSNMLEFLPRQSQRELAMQLQNEIDHTNISLSDLIELIDVSQTWTNMPLVSDDEESDDEKMEDEELTMAQPYIREATGSMNREAKEQQEQKWEEAKKAEAREREKQKAEIARKKEEEEAKRKEESLSASSSSNDVLLKDDPEFAKYFKMLKMGMPREQVLHAMTRDEKDQTVLDLDPNKSLISQRTDETGEVPLNEDPEYEKYFKMLKMGLPMGAVKNALTRDAKDPSVMDLNPKQSLKSQMKGGPSGSDGDNGVALKDDPEYSKYFKMLKMGLPVGAVKNALTKDGKDPAVMDLDPEKSLTAQMSVASEDNGPALKDDPEYAKYFKMLTMGLPIGAVKNALTRDGKDPSIMDLDPNKSINSQKGDVVDAAETGPPLKEDPEYAKYFKMLSMGLPIDAVKNALSRDGKDPFVMDLDPNKSVKSQMGVADEKDTGVPLKDDPEYSKYFKMLGMGLPPGAVKNALERDGKNPAIMDMDPTKSVAFQMKKGSGSKQPVKKKKRVRRKKIYWNPIDPSKLKEDSMWNIVRGAIAMDKLNYDEKEFEDLFTESADPADQKNIKKETKKEEKKLVQVIDPKRSMNGGIVLARLKTEHSQIAEFVNKMDNGKFDSTQLKALKEYLPDADERRGLVIYMKKGDDSPEIRNKLYADCSETEKYMVTMIQVQDAAAKLDVMLFRTIFKNRFEETTDAIRILNAACDELRSSERLRKLMAVILTVVNQINTGGEGKMAMGFTLDALLKLNEAKAFDKKTSVLHYVVKLVKKNDDSLLAFDSDIKSVVPAENVLLDGLSNDVKSIAEELQEIHETIKHEADRLEQAGELKPMTLVELTEQKTAIRVNGGVAQFNKMDHLSGRTQMERFSLNAKVACDQASESIENIKKKYRALLEYFGEDEQMATSDFFGTLRRFIVEWRKAVEQVEAIDKKEAKEKKRAAAKAAKVKKAVGKVELHGKSAIQDDTGGATGSGRQDDTTRKATEDTTRSASMATLAAAAAASRKRGEAQAPQSTSDQDRAIVDSALENRNAVVLQEVLSEELLAGNAQNETERVSKPVQSNISAGDTRSSEHESLPEESVTSMTVAHRGKKEQKDDSDDMKTDFFSAAMAYRKKKSQRDVNSSGGGGDSFDDTISVLIDKTIPSASESFRSHIITSPALESLATKAENEDFESTATDLSNIPLVDNDGDLLAATDSAIVFCGKDFRSNIKGDTAKEEEKGPNSSQKYDSSRGWGLETMLEISAEDDVCSGSDLSCQVEGGQAALLSIDPVGGNNLAEKRNSDDAYSSPNKSQTMTSCSPDTNSAAIAPSNVVSSPELLPTEHVSNLDKEQQEQKLLENGLAMAKSGFQESRNSIDNDTIELPTQRSETIEHMNDVSLQQTVFEKSNMEPEISFHFSHNTTRDPIVGMKEVVSHDDVLSEKPVVYPHPIPKDTVQQIQKRETVEASIEKLSATAQTVIQSNRDPLETKVADSIPRCENVASPLFRLEASDTIDDSTSCDRFGCATQGQFLIPCDEESTRLSEAEQRPQAHGLELDTSDSHDSDRTKVIKGSRGHTDTLHEIRANQEFKADSISRRSEEESVVVTTAHSSQATNVVDIFDDSSDPGNVAALRSFSFKGNECHIDTRKSSIYGTEGSDRLLSGQGPVNFISVVDGQNLESFLNAEIGERPPQNVVSPYLDDSSVGIMAGNLQKRNLDSRLSESWVQGDTIQNFMGWADQAIRASDSESVRNFEFSRDLNDMTDFDDESTIGTMQDDASVMSWSTPSRPTGYADFENLSGALDSNPLFEVAEIHTVRPAQVAASILFNDSPVNSGYNATGASSLGQGTEQDILNMGLFIPTNDFDFDAARLSYAIDDAGLDDGLGFGDNGFSYGNEESFHEFATTSMQLQSEPKSPERKSWFRWMNQN